MEYSSRDIREIHPFKSLLDLEETLSIFSQLDSNCKVRDFSAYSLSEENKAVRENIRIDIEKIEISYNNIVQQIISEVDRFISKPEDLQNIFVNIIKIKCSFDGNKEKLLHYGEIIDQPEYIKNFVDKVTTSIRETLQLLSDKIESARTIPLIPFPERAGALAAKLIYDHINGGRETAKTLKKVSTTVALLHEFLTDKKLQRILPSNKENVNLSLIAGKFLNGSVLTETLTEQLKKCFIEIEFDRKKSAALSAVIEQLNLLNKLKGQLSAIMKMDEQVNIAKEKGSAIDIPHFSEEEIEYIFDNIEIEKIYNEIIENFFFSKGEVINGALLYGERIGNLGEAIAIMRGKIKESEKSFEKKKLGLELHRSFDIGKFCHVFKSPLFKECINAVEEAVQLIPQLRPIVNEHSYKNVILVSLGDLDKYNHPDDLINLASKPIYFLADQNKILQSLLNIDPENQAIISAMEEVENISIELEWELL